MRDKRLKKEANQCQESVQIRVRQGGNTRPCPMTNTAQLQERVVYSAYGQATHHFPADIDGDGDVDSTDTGWFMNLANRVHIDNAGYNPDGDLNRDGSVDTSDLIIALNWNGHAVQIHSSARYMVLAYISEALP